MSTRGETPSPRDAGSWAEPVDHVDVGGAKRLQGPLQGFGKMWQKTYTVELAGADVEPVQVVDEWKANFDAFWPEKTRFYEPIAGIQPGEVARIDSAQGPVPLSTGVMVLYVDATSFAYMNPEGHPWAGWITFSAKKVPSDVTVAMVDLLIRTSDPLYELGFAIYGSRAEDRMWEQTLTRLAAHFDVEAEPHKTVVCVDKRRQWRLAGQVRHNAAIRSVLTAPLRLFRS